MKDVLPMFLTSSNATQKSRIDWYRFQRTAVAFLNLVTTRRLADLEKHGLLVDVQETRLLIKQD